MRRRRTDASEAGFQITPMIDMTFLLLVFFMVTSKLSRQERALRIELPEAHSALSPDTAENRDLINIDGAGVYHLGDEPASTEEVGIHLRRRFRDHPPLRVSIRADRRTPARQLKELLRLCAEAGAVDILIGTRNGS